MESYKDYIVPKPWGYEYLIFENDKIGIWMLSLKNGNRTSLHCHPDKKTGLILLEGNIDVHFLNNFVSFRKFSKIVIREGVFHSSIANEDSIIIEVETPKIKENLVRMEDFYGRQGKKYESKESYKKRTDEHFWIENVKGNKKIFKSFLFYIDTISIDTLIQFNPEDLIVVLDDVLLKSKDGFNISKMGDVLSANTLKRLCSDFELVTECECLIISKEGIHEDT